MKTFAGAYGRCAMHRISSTRTLARTRRNAAAAAAAAFALLAAACGGSSGTPASTSTSVSGQTITYWASDQGSSITETAQVLHPELTAFTKQTGVKVNLEVISWSDLLNRILAATTSGQGPDMVNIGNTWSASLQATGAFLPITASVMSQIGEPAGSCPARWPRPAPPASRRSACRSTRPRTGCTQQGGVRRGRHRLAADHLEQLIADGQKLTHGSQWGLTLEAGQTLEDAHAAFVFSEQQGGSWFDSWATRPSSRRRTSPRSPRS